MLQNLPPSSLDCPFNYFVDLVGIGFAACLLKLVVIEDCSRRALRLLLLLLRFEERSHAITFRDYLVPLKAFQCLFPLVESNYCESSPLF